MGYTGTLLGRLYKFNLTTTYQYHEIYHKILHWSCCICTYQ
jgi:hypothetical protein